MDELPVNCVTVEELLGNEAFRRWVLYKSPADRIRWQEWLHQHPDKRELYEQAVAVYLALEGTNPPMSDREVREKTARITSQFTGSPDELSTGSIRPLWSRLRWIAAASVLLAGLWWQFQPVTSTLALTFRKQPKIDAPAGNDWKEVKNVAAVPMVVLLPENSSVLLYPYSRIRFRKTTSAALREVYLEGEGFFEVSKNPAKPFVVYTSTLTTRVLGTSFQIRSFKKEATAFVKVKTGKVTVSPVDFPEKQTLLTINEQLTLAPNSVQVAKKEPVSPVAGEKPDMLTQQFSYEFTPVTQIFDQLERTYHMPIICDRKLLQHCTFTGQLNDTPFPDKIRLICLTIESTCEVVNNQVIIHSKGCN